MNFKSLKFIKSLTSGFTIVETLVAITVLMIAIAGPLVVASKGLFGATLSKDQMIASYLAQESVEVVKNIRDNNIVNGVAWLNGISGCKQASPCDASAIDSGNTKPSVLTGCSSSDLCQLYKETDGYGHAPAAGDQTSMYHRAFFFHNASGPGDCTSDEECGLSVKVTWNEGVIPYDVVVTTEMTSTLR